MTRRLLAILAAGFALVAACSDDDTNSADGTDESTTDSVSLNEVQVLGSHNSYHLRPPAKILDAISAFMSPEFAAEFDYEHRPLTEQLEEFGIRQFELDVYADPAGGRFSTRPALELLGLPTDSGVPELDEPGFKVLHQADIDFETTCFTLVACLGEIEEWSTASPDHEPIMIMVEAKQESIADATDGDIDSETLGVDLTEVLTFDRATFDALEDEILTVFDEDRVITPDDVRGEADTLEEAVLDGDAWPTLDESRGKVLFALLDTGETRETYIGDATSLEGRLLFTSSEEGRPDAAFIRVDDPLTEGERIQDLVSAGYLIRTRTDVPGIDAPAGDTARREAAIASGAQYLSTDYYVEDPGLGTGFTVALPGDGPVRCNPVDAPADCDF